MRGCVHSACASEGRPAAAQWRWGRPAMCSVKTTQQKQAALRNAVVRGQLGACHQHDTLVPVPERAMWRCTFCDSEQPDDGLWIAALA